MSSSQILLQVPVSQLKSYGDCAFIVAAPLCVCFSWRIHRLALIQYSLYVGVVEKTPPPPLTGEQYGKMEPKYPEGGHCHSVLRPQGVFNVPLYFK